MILSITTDSGSPGGGWYAQFGLFVSSNAVVFLFGRFSIRVEWGK